jgi:hypothetical protein
MYYSLSKVIYMHAQILMTKLLPQVNFKPKVITQQCKIVKIKKNVFVVTDLDVAGLQWLRVSPPDVTAGTAPVSEVGSSSDATMSTDLSTSYSLLSVGK